MENIKRNLKLKSNASCILDIGNTATSRWTSLGLVHHPDAHRCPNYLIALLLEKPGSRARINPPLIATTTLCFNYCPFIFHAPHPSPLPPGEREGVKEIFL